MTCQASRSPLPARHDGPVSTPSSLPDGRPSVDPRFVARAVAALAESAFAEVEAVRAATESALTGSPRRRADLAPLEAVVDTVLATPDALPVGAGFVAQPGALDDQEYWLEWWVLPGGRAPSQRLRVEVDPGGDTFRDYTALPWFRIPHDTGARHLTGPYVDYLCTDEYTLTFTTPVVVGGEFLGVAGADVYVREVERRIMPLLHALPGACAVVNRQGRVVLATGDADTGSLLRRVDVEQLWRGADVPGATFDACPGLPLAVVTFDG